MTFHCPPAADVEVIRRGVTGGEGGGHDRVPRPEDGSP
jgi:hypothetical protein